MSTFLRDCSGENTTALPPVSPVTLLEELHGAEKFILAKVRIFVSFLGSITAVRPEAENESEEGCSKVHNLSAWVNWPSYLDAEKMLVKAMTTRKKIVGDEHEDTLSSISMVALLYNFRGRLQEAEELELQVVVRR
jgi:Tetratricopeptide repeat